jgi:hypothetical protein
MACDRIRRAAALPQVTIGSAADSAMVCKTVSCDWRMPKIRKQQASVRVG